MSDQPLDSKKQYVSPFPGKVLQILVQEGATVKKGDGLLVLESMKMEVRVEAAVSGEVEIFVKEGQLIQDGTILCKVQTDEDVSE